MIKFRKPAIMAMPAMMAMVCLYGLGVLLGRHRPDLMKASLI